MIILNARTPLDPSDAELLGPHAPSGPLRFLASLGAVPTPLMGLPDLAASIGVGAIYLKNEGERLGLGSFKALGGAYAVERLASQPGMVFTCATDGNHGRAVAYGARLVGARSVVFVHRGVSQPRIDAIAELGAEIVRVDGNYDESVAEAARVAEERGWTLVSDTAWDGYERIPGLVMQGYTVIVKEALDALPELPTHVFMQAGVGGLAAAVAGHFAHRPTFVVVEPARAACLFESARAGRLVTVDPQPPTVMAMLECYRPSLTAWRILSHLADAFMTVEEDEATKAVQSLAPISASESGAAGLAGLMQAARDPQIRAQLSLDESSRVFLVVSERSAPPGATLRASHEGAGPIDAG
jgi:diaminopropionate ammonia-lyase